MTLVISEKAYLEHYGVKGMQWGVRNEKRQERKKFKRELKAKKFDTKASDYQKAIDKLDVKLETLNNNKLSSAFAKKRINELKIDLQKEKAKAESDAQASREGKLTSNQKKVLIGAGAAAALLVAYGSYRGIQSGEFHRKALKGKAFITGKDLTSFNKRKDLMSKDWVEDQKQDEL